MSFDSQVKMEQARQRLPLKTLLEQNGHGPKGGNWRSFQCPLCQHPTAAGVTAAAGTDLLKCFNTGGKKHPACPGNNKAVDEVGYLELTQGISRRDAFVLYLKQAGVWEENKERLGPSVLPGARPRKAVVNVVPPPAPGEESPAPSPAPPAPAAGAEDPFFEPPGIASDIPTIYEAENPPQAEANPTPTSNPAPALTAPTESANPRCDDPSELSPPEAESTSAPVAGATRAPGPEEGADEGEGELVAEGAECAETRPRAGDPNRLVISADEVRAWMLSSGDSTGEAAPDGADGTVPAGPAGPPAAGTGGPERAGQARRARIVVTTDEVREAVRWFYDRLIWREEDVLATLVKRGLEPHTQRVFGLRANRFENLALLQALHEPGSPRFPLEVLLKAGLWERSWDAQREQLDSRRFPEGFTPQVVEGCHPARHFFGYSFMGTQKGGDGEKRPRYEWAGAPLIPYFDWLPEQEQPGIGFAGITEGEFKAMAWWQVYAEDVATLPDPDPARLVALRPHKHWAKGATPQTFLTPPGGGTLMWQGQRLEFGCAALPGIAFARKRGGTWSTRHELDEWLRLNQAEFACVVFDNEEKGDPSLPRYHPNVEARHDAMAWGLFLARDLAKHRTAALSVLPDHWRDRQGKADWDGALARMWDAEEPAEPAGNESGRQENRKG